MELATASRSRSPTSSICPPGLQEHPDPASRRHRSIAAGFPKERWQSGSESLRRLGLSLDLDSRPSRTDDGLRHPTGSAATDGPACWSTVETAPAAQRSADDLANAICGAWGTHLGFVMMDVGQPSRPLARSDSQLSTCSRA